MSSSEVRAADQPSDDERGAVIGVLQSALTSLEELQDQRDAQPMRVPLTEDPEYKRAKKRAMNMLAGRDHSSAELRKKLVDREHPPHIVDALIDGLERSHLLNDKEFARSFVRAKRAGRALSKQALRRELGKKGVSAADAGAALDTVDDEFDLALQVARKKAAATVALPYDTRKRRILGMLARRGFPQGICLNAADAAIELYPGTERRD